MNDEEDEVPITFRVCDTDTNPGVGIYWVHFQPATERRVFTIEELLGVRNRCNTPEVHREVVALLPFLKTPPPLMKWGKWIEQEVDGGWAVSRLIGPIGALECPDGQNHSDEL